MAAQAGTEQERKSDWLDKAVVGLFWFSLAAMLAMGLGQFRWDPPVQAFQNAHLAFALWLGLIGFMMRKRTNSRWGIALVLMLGVVIAEYYFFQGAADFFLRSGVGTWPDIILGMMIFGTVLVVAYMYFGIVFPVLGVIFLTYHFTSGLLPGFLHGADFEAWRVLTRTAQAQHTGVVDQASRFLWLLIFWGILLATGGAGLIVTGMARFLSKRLVGGPAMGALVASGVAGSFIGAGPNNVAITGPITIPAMVRGGYRADEAGAIEGVASNASTITPPILGIVAFVMANLLGISYLEVIKMALVPAAMWYVGTAAYIVGHAKRNDDRIRQVVETEQERADQPTADQEAWPYIRGGLIVFAPLVLLLLNFTTIRIFPWLLFGDGAFPVFLSAFVMVLAGVVASVGLAMVTRSPAGMYIRSAVIAVIPVGIIMALVLEGFTLRTAIPAALMSTLMLGVTLRVETRWARWSSGIKSAAGYASAVSIVLVIVTILADTIGHTGVGTRFGAIVNDISGGSVAIAGGLLIVLSVIMAAGLPNLAIYFLVTVTFVPILFEMGVDIRASHFVAFYMGSLSLIVPPVAGSAIVAAAIAGTTYAKVSWQLVRMAWPFYIFPIVLLLAPDDLLLLSDSEFDNGLPTVLVIVALAVVLIGIQMASGGWVGVLLNPLTRAAFYAVGAIVFYALLREHVGLLILAPLLTIGLAAGLITLGRLRPTKQPAAARVSGGSDTDPAGG